MSLIDDRMKVLRYLAENDKCSNYVYIELLLGPHRTSSHAKRTINGLLTDGLIELKPGTGKEIGGITIANRKRKIRRIEPTIKYKPAEARITTKGYELLSRLPFDKELNKSTIWQNSKAATATVKPLQEHANKINTDRLLTIIGIIIGLIGLLYTLFL